MELQKKKSPKECFLMKWQDEVIVCNYWDRYYMSWGRKGKTVRTGRADTDAPSLIITPVARLLVIFNYWLLLSIPSSNVLLGDQPNKLYTSCRCNGFTSYILLLRFSFQIKKHNTAIISSKMVLARLFFGKVRMRLRRTRRRLPIFSSISLVFWTSLR